MKKTKQILLAEKVSYFFEDLDLYFDRHFCRLKYKLKHFYQKLRYGFSDEELWNLDITTSQFLVPRLKSFKQYTQGYPSDLGTHEKWLEILDDMIYYHEKIIDWNYFDLEDQRYKDGKKYFFEYYEALWH